MNEDDEKIIRQAQDRLASVAESDAKDERWIYANGRVWREVRHEGGAVGLFPIATTIEEEDGGQRETIGEFVAASFVAIRELVRIVKEQDKRARHAEAERDAYDKRIAELEAEVAQLRGAMEAKLDVGNYQCIVDMTSEGPLPYRAISKDRYDYLREAERERNRMVDDSEAEQANSWDEFEKEVLDAIGPEVIGTIADAGSDIPGMIRKLHERYRAEIRRNDARLVEYAEKLETYKRIANMKQSKRKDKP